MLYIFDDSGQDILETAAAPPIAKGQMITICPDNFPLSDYKRYTAKTVSYSYRKGEWNTHVYVEKYDGSVTIRD